MATSSRDRIRAAREKMARGDATEAEALAEERRVAQAKREKQEARKIVRALEQEVAQLEERQAYLDELASAPDPEPFVVTPKGKKHKGLQEATYVALASDWHMGERVRPENVGSRNEYDPSIAQERAHQFFESNLILLNMARQAWTIDQAVLWLGGDLMTGYIHEEYMEENFLSPVEESLLVYETMVAGIDFLLAKSDLRHILVPTSNGNHGRTGKKIKIASYAKNSFEWLLYQQLASHYRDEPRLEFRVASGYHNVVDLYGLRVGFHHGDAIGYSGGVGGLSIPANRRFGRQAQAVPPRWEGTELAAPHLQCFGHFHQSLYPGSFICNGSLIGWNDFAERIGCPYEDPT
ncbi:MAG: hypothetical protein R3253_14935, partial [Longimicrobiales bacterium]|nr:hypothetical protein [Longimicrobiales bacterium]